MVSTYLKKDEDHLFKHDRNMYLKAPGRKILCVSSAEPKTPNKNMGQSQKFDPVPASQQLHGESRTASPSRRDFEPCCWSPRWPGPWWGQAKHQRFRCLLVDHHGKGQSLLNLWYNYIGWKWNCYEKLMSHMTIYIYHTCPSSSTPPRPAFSFLYISFRTSTPTALRQPKKNTVPMDLLKGGFSYGSL